MTNKFSSSTEFWRGYIQDVYISLLEKSAAYGNPDAKEKLKNPEKALEFLEPYMNITLEALDKKEKEEKEYLGFKEKND